MPRQRIPFEEFEQIRLDLRLQIGEFCERLGMNSTSYPFERQRGYVSASRMQAAVLLKRTLKPRKRTLEELAEHEAKRMAGSRSKSNADLVLSSDLFLKELKKNV